MQLPLEIVQVGENSLNRKGKTRDISSGGVCFLSSDAMEPGGRIEYLITLSGSNPPVKIRCLGKVLRSQKPVIAEGETSEEASEEGDAFEVAVTMERYTFVRSEELNQSTQRAAVQAMPVWR